MARLVLVHGAFGGAWVWEPILDALRAAGHAPDPIDLPGAGNDATPPEEVTLERYAQRICDKLAEGEPAVLLGQSMGGIAVTQAAASCPGNVSALVYVGAFAPAEGQSLMDLVAYPEAADDQVQAHMVLEGDVAILPPDAARHALYNCAPADQATWAAQRLGPQPVKPLGDRVTLPNANRVTFEALPRAYIVCQHDRAIPPAMQRRMAHERGCGPIIELDADHWPWMSRPDAFIDALDRIVQAGVVEAR
jgi:pimeloyl-ACP methyl ester carboxylesterase